MSCFTQAQLQAIADALGDTNDGLIGSEIAHLLATCSIVDVDSAMTKRHRLYNAFANDRNQRKDRTHVLGFVRHAMKPERFIKFPERFEPMRNNLNAIIPVDAGANAGDATEPLRLRFRRADERDRAADFGALRLLGVAGCPYQHSCGVKSVRRRRPKALSIETRGIRA